MTKNCSPKRAKRLWKKFIKKNYNYPIGVYTVGYAKRKFFVEPLAPKK
jgi:hypothetical protein